MTPLLALPPSQESGDKDSKPSALHVCKASSRGCQISLSRPGGEPLVIGLEFYKNDDFSRSLSEVDAGKKVIHKDRTSQNLFKFFFQLFVRFFLSS